MRQFATLCFGLILLLISGSSCHKQGTAGSPWPEVTSEAKPWTRWWWLGSEVDRENIGPLLEACAEAGFGGVEITPVYGVKGHEAHYLEFLSPAWMEMLEFTLSEAEKSGMGVDMNLGTGWPFGGPQITPEYAASKLVLRSWEITGDHSLAGRITPGDTEEGLEGTTLEALMAFADDGRILDLTRFVEEDGTLDWVPGQGRWELLAAFCGKTGQMVKRAAPGGEGFSMDHFSADALAVYLHRFDEAFGEGGGVRSFFNDSYEVYHASWTPGFFDEFLLRRGYDLRNHLKAFSETAAREYAARVKSDYRQTLAELLLGNFTVPWTSWSHGRGSLTRNQAHGSPGNLVDLYAAVDIPECEIYGHRAYDIPGMRINTDDSTNVEPNPMMLKLATSAAHVTGKPLISNETFTWLGEHFKVALSQCRPEAEEAFLAGINHLFCHGTTYSPAGAAWPGWLFYASVHFGPTNTFWPHLPGMNEYITRCQSVLQSGKPDNDLLAYWPVFDIWHNPGGLEMQLSVHNIEEWLLLPGIDRMAETGISYDFISDALLQQVEPARGELRTAGGSMAYKGLVVPACLFMPVTTLEAILELARQGGLVVFERLPEDVPGWHELEKRRGTFRAILGSLEFRDAGHGIRECRTGKGTVLLSQDLGKALEYAGIKGERIGDYGLKYARRSAEGGKWYFLVNHGSATADAMVPLNTPAASVLIMDPISGKAGKAVMQRDGDRTWVRVQLRPGQSLFLRTYDSRGPRNVEWAYEETRHQPVELRGPWELSFISGGPSLPAPRELDELRPWTGLGDPGLLDFSGIASYTLKFLKPEITADRTLLELGELHESARVWLNGKEAGIVWSLPFEIDVTGFLQDGENRLTIEVASLMANRIRYMDREEIPWRNFHDINFVNLAYRPFDASDWPTQCSGLAGPVRLIPVETR